MIKIRQNIVAAIPIRDPDVSPGGIIIPDEAKDRTDQGIVKYVGPNVQDIRPGDYIVFSGYTGTILKIEGEGNLILLPEDKVEAVISDVPNVEIPGLYFKGADGYFPANYEYASELMARAFTDYRKTLSIKEIHPLEKKSKVVEMYSTKR